MLRDTAQHGQFNAEFKAYIAAESSKGDNAIVVPNKIEFSVHLCAGAR